ncbi:MAG: glycosyltransferase family 4 protein [Nitrososphaerota archaeon]|nr:glycosyltransferase family 4 protein [Nitrososphaerota archaeon]MDG6936886.1 glycosyltransferase family 4 protein [Nitrososphaerota archaeon]MDG6944877.1 glycosyltransferase family 4 protein [Nitrososphaerota archaeon]
MKILWFAHRDIKHPQAGGAERTIYEVGRRLVGMGHELQLVSVIAQGLCNRENIEGINIERVPGNVPAHLLVPYYISKHRPDAIVDDLAHVVPWGSPLFTEKPVIVFFRHLHARSLPGQVNTVMAAVLSTIERRYRLVYDRNMFVTESKTSVNDLIQLGISKYKIIRILPGVDKDLFKPRPKPEEPTMVYFGGMRNYKRPWLSIELLRRLNKNVKLIMVGDGPSLSKVKGLCETYKLCDRVKFTGRVEYSELARLLSLALVNLHFSTVEGFGYSIVEAAAAGTPTAALDAPGVSDVINEFGLGVLGKDLEELKSKVLQLMADHSHWSAKVLEGSNNFSWDKSTNEWDRLLSETL